VAQSKAFRIARVSLSAGVLTPITPPQAFTAVSIGNATATDLEVHTQSDGSEYLVVVSGYERALPVVRTQFDSYEIAFWLKSTGGGTAVIIWH
jgi:hypothetical protein